VNILYLFLHLLMLKLASLLFPLFFFLFSPLAAMIGLLYPCIDSRLGEPHKFNAVSLELDFANNVQLGFGLGICIAFLGTLATQLLVYNGVFQYTSPDFLYIRSWLPCIFFAGVITMGNIGRQLALYEYKFIQDKSHQD
uniref:Insulin-induced gene protein n=1 Tax=Maylandia zebra TaxID=106582 RepID=A0A3P9CS81_9CICH